MRIFSVGQGRTRICGETYLLYVAAGNPRRTPPSGKKTIYGWKLIKSTGKQPDLQKATFIDTGHLNW
jgi:hypothetical protein